MTLISSQQICPVTTAQDLLSYGFSFIHNAPIAQKTSSPNIQQFFLRLITSVSTNTIKQYSELITLISLYAMIVRTHSYIQDRKSGKVGPALAIPLLKFWSIYGFIQCLFYILTLYLTPFHADWIISFLRAFLFIILSSGQYLSTTDRLYDEYLFPFYNQHSNEIDQFFLKCKTNWKKINEDFQKLAKYLLMKISVDGLSGLSPFPSAEDLQKETQESVKERTLEQKPTDPSNLVDNFIDRSVEKRFFAGAGNDRAQAVQQSLSSKDLNGVVQMTPVQPPKAPFEDARKLREEFRNRLKRKASRKTIK